MTPLPACDRDDISTLLAAGVLAYVAQILLHEAAGHGGACLAEGHRILVIAPLWMRCNVADLRLTVAGPAMNVLAAIASGAALRGWRPGSPALALLLWLSFVFNALVACGYLGVGAATGFGDWPVIFSAILPIWLWRVPALLTACLGYYACLRIAAWLYTGFACANTSAAHDFRRRALYPASGAAMIACLAEIAGGRIAVLPMLLALGCTIGVGYSLTSMDGVVADLGGGTAEQGVIFRVRWIILAALAVAVAFVLLLGPGLRFGEGRPSF